jgi:hypothetical protein
VAASYFAPANRGSRHGSVRHRKGVYRGCLLCDLTASTPHLPPIFSVKKRNHHVVCLYVKAAALPNLFCGCHRIGLRGVISHHILHRADLPAISNWWSLLLVPTLVWLLTGAIARRFSVCETTRTNGLKMAVFSGFTGGFLIGAGLSIAFQTNHLIVAAVLFQGMFLLALFVRLYRAEYLLGIVLAMMFTFGAVLPTAIGSMVGAVAATMHLLIYPNLKRAWKWVSNRLNLRT